MEKNADNSVSTDTIVAIATALGRGGVGVIRISGPAALSLAHALVGNDRSYQPRKTHLVTFLDNQSRVIDEGLLIYFAAPHSFTGEEVIECHVHGGVMVLQSMQSRLLQLGARLANPGEFSQRAFLNGKLDLTQAEAIADLIDAGSQQAARSAARSLRGEFSQVIQLLVDDLLRLRVLVEALIDFSDEADVADQAVLSLSTDLTGCLRRLDEIFKSARQGMLLARGVSVALAGEPNAGKSSLLNRLLGQERAIVTAMAGTTRDVLSESVSINGLVVNLSDTAGLRDTDHEIEQVGVERAKQMIAAADCIVWVWDSTLDAAGERHNMQLIQDQALNVPLIVVANKIDCCSGVRRLDLPAAVLQVSVSAKTGDGLDQLREMIYQVVGFGGASEDTYSARARHLSVLKRARTHLVQAVAAMQTASFECIAEDLWLAQKTLGEMTGEVTSDALLGEIFSSFCVGK